MVRKIWDTQKIKISFIEKKSPTELPMIFIIKLMLFLFF